MWVCVLLCLAFCSLFSKTTVIGPLLALILADGRRLVTQVVPSALLEFSRSIMRSRFTHIITKRIHTVSSNAARRTTMSREQRQVDEWCKDTDAHPVVSV